MKLSLVLLVALATAQSVIDPPEFTGTPKKGERQPTELQLAFSLGLGELKKWVEVMPTVTAFLVEHPAFGDGYALRVFGEYCELKKPATEAMLADIEKAMQYHTPESAFGKLPNLYGMKARLEYDLGRFEAAMDTIERGIRLSPSDAKDVVATGGVKPEPRAEPDSPCSWTQTDLDGFARRFPKDYRVPLYRGVHLSERLATFEQPLVAKSIAEFEKALALNPKAALAQYFIGEVHATTAFWALGDSDEARNATRRRAVSAYSLAIRLDPRLKAAYLSRADVYLKLKQYAAAQRDYDKVIELDPKDAGAHHDRAIARNELGNIVGAIIDYDEAIRLGTLSESSILNAYENRGYTHVKAGMYTEAVDDFSAVIEIRFQGLASIMNLNQFRSLYPEYKALSDAALIKKVHDRFTPVRADMDKYAKQLMENKPFSLALLADAYEKRMDAYLRAERYQRALADYNRTVIASGSDGKLIDRWRPMGKTKDGEKFIDIKSLEFGDQTRLWMKTTKPKGYDLDAFEIDCRAKRIRNTIELTYDDDGQNTRSLGTTAWQTIIPDTLGEQLHDATCRN